MSKLDRVIAADSQPDASPAAAGEGAWTRPELVRIDPASPKADRARAAFAARGPLEQH